LRVADPRQGDFAKPGCEIEAAPGARLEIEHGAVRLVPQCRDFSIRLFDF